MTNYTLKIQRFKISSHIQTFTKHKMRYNFTKKKQKTVEVTCMVELSSVCSVQWTTAGKT